MILFLESLLTIQEKKSMESHFFFQQKQQKQKDELTIFLETFFSHKKMKRSFLINTSQ